MHKHFMILAVIGGSFALSGCATLKGAGIGAAAGAGTQAIRGKNVKDGAVAGAAVGAVVGTVVD